MSAVATTVTELLTPKSAEKRAIFRHFEDAVVSLILAGMVVIPLAEAVLRRTLHRGIPASTSIVQHAVLLVGMLGGAIAAREGRLLALSTLEHTLIPDKFRPASHIVTSSVAAAVTGFLALASAQFVLSEREAGKFLFSPIRVWWIEMVMPLAFALIALRILQKGAPGWRGRVLAMALTAVAVVAFVLLSGKSHVFVPPSLGILLIASVLGVPAFVTLGGAALLLFSSLDQPIASIPIAHYALVINPVLPTLPLFTLAGYFLAEGGRSQAPGTRVHCAIQKLPWRTSLSDRPCLCVLHIRDGRVRGHHSRAWRIAHARPGGRTLHGEKRAGIAYRKRLARAFASPVFAHHRVCHRRACTHPADVPWWPDSRFCDDHRDQPLGNLSRPSGS